MPYIYYIEVICLILFYKIRIHTSDQQHVTFSSPARSGATFEWSGRVLCGDETAGCTSFALSTGAAVTTRWS